jgi:hypothetical protein
MPQGDVRLHEFLEAIQDRIVDQVAYLSGMVDVVDADADTAPEVLRKALGTGRYGVRIMPASPAMVPSPGLGQTTLWDFHALIVVLFRKMGAMSSRPKDDQGSDITVTTKEVIDSLMGQRLSLLNQGGVSCGPTSYVTDGSSLQAMIFTASGSSREAR